MPNENRILIVDDDPDIHRLLAAALSDANYLVEDNLMASNSSALSYSTSPVSEWVISVGNGMSFPRLGFARSGVSSAKSGRPR